MESLGRSPGYDRLSVQYMGPAILNPYEPPSVAAVVRIADNCSHDWRGRNFAISARAAAAVLWMNSVITVAIDGSEFHRQKVLQSDGTFRFSFLHDGRMVEAQVFRGLGFFTRCIQYELVVDGESVAKSRASIDNWKRGIAVMLTVNLIVFGWIGSLLLLR